MKAREITSMCLGIVQSALLTRPELDLKCSLPYIQVQAQTVHIKLKLFTFLLLMSAYINDLPNGAVNGAPYPDEKTSKGAGERDASDLWHTSWLSHKHVRSNLRLR